ncbi:MAG TPA: RDD family protein [Acidobacteriaceae bacterium]|jgi:uncharacterized RDD family membrane protein YckC
MVFSIETPELVDLEFPLAGIGSRFIAILIDYALQFVGFLLLILVALLFLPSMQKFESASAKWMIAILILIPFLLQWGYFTLFEGLWHGQTPGKRVAKIRVIQQSGRAITIFESLSRNLVRIIDFLPTVYVVGTISIFVTSRNQRLGDLVAGTLVVHEGQTRDPSSLGKTRLFTEAAPPAPAAPRAVRLPADALSRLGASDLQAIETFLERRLDMTLEVRQTLAARLVASTAARMKVPPPNAMHPETFLEEVAYGVRSLGMLHP